MIRLIGFAPRPDVARHQLVAEERLAPVPVARALRRRGPLDRHPARARAEEGVVLGDRPGPQEQRGRRPGPGEQPERLPDRADPQDVPHLVRDHVVQRAVGFHRGQVGRVELHHAVDRQRGVAADVVGPGLAEDAAGPVDRHRLGVDQEVIHQDSLVIGVGQVADDDLLPPRRGPVEGQLLRRRQPRGPDDDVEGPRRIGGVAVGAGGGLMVSV